MAEGNGEDENPYSFRNFNRKKQCKSDDDSASSQEACSVKPDLGIGSEHDSEKRGIPDNPVTGNEAPKREENPFSFKHFLKRDSSSSYQNTGARPKVYNNICTENDHNELDMDLETNLYRRSGSSRHVGTPELTSVLPDFVQDHLVVEQCYLNHSDTSTTPQLTVDLENLPDFAISNMSPAQDSSPNKSGSKLRHWEEPKNADDDDDDVAKDIPFDLTGSTIRNQHFPGRVRKNSGPVPLDLPLVESDSVAPSVRLNGGLPFDLPLVHDVDVAAQSSVSSARSGPSLGEVGVSKSLPDFLSDGPIHSGRHNDEPNDMSNGGNGNGRVQSSEDNIQRLQIENERLRRELDISRRQISEQTRRIQFLEKEMCTMQSKENEETAHLEKAIEQVEDNLKRTTRRAVLAENQVSKLKQEKKMILNEMTQLQRENHELRTGCFPGNVEPNQELIQRLAQDLKAAAGTAEVSLRQLLTGVENLRVISATMESMHRIRDRTSDFLVDDDDDDNGDAAASGPAL